MARSVCADGFYRVERGRSVFAVDDDGIHAAQQLDLEVAAGFEQAEGVPAGTHERTVASPLFSLGSRSLDRVGCFTHETWEERSEKPELRGHPELRFVHRHT